MNVIYECPLCNEMTDAMMYYEHLNNKHLDYLLTISSMMLPTFNENDIFNMLNLYVEEENDYENLSNLCEEMGNVYIGVSDIDKVAPATVCDSKDKCPICFENFTTIINDTNNFIRKTKKCKHSFCNICITTWLEKHKSCPMCKIDLTELEVQSESDEQESPNGF